MNVDRIIDSSIIITNLGTISATIVVFPYFQ